MQLEPQQAEAITRLTVNTDFHVFCSVIDTMHSKVIHELPNLDGDKVMKHVGELKAFEKLKRVINDAPKYRRQQNAPTA